jgi:hypothetical protein
VVSQQQTLQGHGLWGRSVGFLTYNLHLRITHCSIIGASYCSCVLDSVVSQQQLLQGRGLRNSNMRSHVHRNLPTYGIVCACYRSSDCSCVLDAVVR